MKESLWGYYLVLLGITVSTVMIMVSNMTTTNQQNYYLLKEVTNAAMIDAIDYGYYREYGTIKINTEKFVENFLRRFSEGISKTNTYKIDFYSIYENPPSVSIRVTSNTGDYNIAGDSTNIDVVNSYDAILEANNTISFSKIFYSVPYGSCTGSTDCRIINKALFNFINEGEFGASIVNEVKDRLPSGEVFDSSKLKIVGVEYIEPMSTSDDTEEYEKLFESTYSRESSMSDVTGQGSDEPSVETHYAKNIKDVNMTIKEKDGKYYLGYGLSYNCNDVTTYTTYRLGTNFYNLKHISENAYNSGDYSNKYYYKSDVADAYDNYTTNFITKTEYNSKSDAEKENYIKFEKAPWYGNCLIGIKYKIDFYYDNAS